jgi:hypothetical protein
MNALGCQAVQAVAMIGKTQRAHGFPGWGGLSAMHMDSYMSVTGVYPPITWRRQLRVHLQGKRRACMDMLLHLRVRVPVCVLLSHTMHFVAAHHFSQR